jgi:hypothetical protein
MEANEAWKNNYTYNIIIFVLFTIVQCLIIGVAFQSQWIKEITINFPKYRCNPIMMPFVSLFGFNTSENFNFCVQGIFNVKAAEVFVPIYGILNTFQEVITTLVNAAMSIRGMFSNFFSGVQNFITGLRNKIQYLMNNVRMSFIRIFNLMGKVYGSMFAVLFMGQSAMTAAFNLSDNDLVKFLFEFCFAPDTPIQLSNGEYKPIVQIKIGDVLANNAVVESVFRFSGTKTQMVQIADVVLSSQHYVLGPDGQMIHAALHPAAYSVNSIPELVCLNVSGHRFAVGHYGLIVADYDEHSSPAVIAQAQNIAEKALNGFQNSPAPIDDYSLGVGGNTEMELADGSWKRTDALQIGDILKHAGAVLGIVQENCDNVIISAEGIVHSPSQFVYNMENHRWVRSARRWPGRADGAAILYNVITHNTSAIHLRACGTQADEYIRDYREVPLPEMEHGYEKEFLIAH